MAVDLHADLVPIRNARQQLERARACGVEAAQVLADTGLHEFSLQRQSRLSYRQMIQIYRNLDAAPLPADYFLGNGDTFSIADYGVMGYAMMSAANLRQAIQVALRYYHTAGPLVEVGFAADQHTAYIVLADAFELGPALYAHVVEEVISTFPPLMRILTGTELAPATLEFSYPAPAHADAYQSRFRRPAQFDRPHTRFGLPLATLDVPVLDADPSVAALLEHSCQELLDDATRYESFTRQVGWTLMHGVARANTAHAVAQRLNVSERTLRRRLAAEDTRFQEVLDDVRMRLARNYLEKTGLSTQEIAELLGFTEATNFRRAFLRWTGASPHRYRQDAAARAGAH